MEEDIGLLAMNGNVACCALRDGIGRRGDVLVLPIFFARLCVLSLYSGLLAEVGIGNE